MKKLLLLIFAVTSCFGANASNESSRRIVPYPNHIQYGQRSFDLAGATIALDPRTDDRTRRAAEALAAQMGLISGKKSDVVRTNEMSDYDVRFIVDPALPEEGYRLIVNDEGVEIHASRFAGFVYAIQSLKQLMPVTIFGTEPIEKSLLLVPHVEINDAPRFGYRGMHLDVARHFFPVEEVKRYIDMMAVHKLNRLHWHLTDDQGWRIEIKHYPELTSIGSIRKQTMVGKNWGEYDGKPYGGSYTQDEIRDIVAYAADRAIEVIPEIDLPGHMLSALTAYPDLGCTGGPYEVWGRWGIADDVLCVGQEKTYEFLENVLDEIVELFPSQLIHIGGDECPKVRWEKCPRCQAKIQELGLKDQNGYKAEHYLQGYVTDRIGKYLATKGRRVIGWDEVLEGEAPADAVIMSWRGTAGGIKAAQLGHDVIMTPNSYFYFDYYQSPDIENEPLGIGGYVPIDKVYSYDPMDELTPEQQKHILGVQANLWTEYIATSDHLEYMLLPRLSALSEVQWTQPENKDWNRFSNDFRMDKIYRQMKFNYARSPFNVRGTYAVDPQKRAVVTTLSTLGGAPIHYTLDGSQPTDKSPIYNAPIAVDKSEVLRAAVLREGKFSPEYNRKFEFGKSTARPATLNSKPEPKYTYEGASLLVDGYHGTATYSNGAWLGFRSEPLDVTIDMGGKERYSMVTLEALVLKNERALPPTSVKLYVSDNGTDFTELATLDVPQAKADDADGVQNYRLEFEPTSARFVKVVARNEVSIPQGLPNAGKPAYLFVDEIVVE